MSKYLKNIILLSLLLLPLLTFSLNVKVRLLSEYAPKSVLFTTISGRYTILCDNNKLTTINLEPGNSLLMTYYIDGRIKLEQGIELIGTFSDVEFLGTKYNNVFSLKAESMKKERVYEENLRITIADKELLIINTIALEKYVAGVVQSEIYGSSTDVEFFKIQAIASRTYCLANLNRHLKHGYNLCDCVHCQSYKGRCTQADILRATYETFSDVIVDNTDRLISPAYHSNSGGQTEAAANLWQKDLPYLQSKIDTFSVGARNYQWEKSIPRRLWIDFFVSKYGQKYAVGGELQEALFSFQQPKRISKWVLASDTILTKEIREHFKLRSAFFSVSLQGDDVILKGKGYGHGVGLSQEGAIEMVRRGFSCDEIIQFYFDGVRVIKYTEIIDL